MPGAGVAQEGGRGATPSLTVRGYSPEAQQHILRATEETGTDPHDVPDPVLDVLATGSGQSLDASIQRALEERMDADFSDVEIPTGPAATKAADAIDARAFTCGNAIVFNQDEYDPESEEGQYLLAHELAHVDQATAGGVHRLPTDGRIADLQDGEENITALVHQSVDTSDVTEEQYECLCAIASVELDRLREAADTQMEFSEMCAAVREELQRTKDELTEISRETPSEKPYATSRPSYAKGQEERVWEQAKGLDGTVHDPNTNEVLEWDRDKPRRGQWDMGHDLGEEYWRKHEAYMDGAITKEQFLQWYRDPNNYRPEDPSENRSRKHENP